MIQRFCILLLFLSILFAAACSPTFAQDGLAKSSQALRAKAQELAVVAQKIRINGRDRGWKMIPRFHEEHDQDCSDRSRDLVSTSVAPLSDRILVMLETRDTPAKEDKSFWIEVDLMGARSGDFEIGFSSTNQHTFWIYEDGKPPKEGVIHGVKYKIKSHFVAEIPISEIKQAYERANVEFPADALDRGWVRVIPFTYSDKVKKDLGPSAASPILDRPEFFDNPITAAQEHNQLGRSIQMPLPTKKWYVGQGAFGVWTHQDVNAYDLYITDSSMEPALQPKSTSNEGYYCWEADIVAPTRARVVRTQDSTADNNPFDSTRQGDANSVHLDIGGNTALRFLHCRQNSVIVEPGEIVSSGTVLAKVGNSASSACAHLHFDVWKLPMGEETLPVALENIRVSLNSADDCPWTCEFPLWVIQEGLFVEQIPANSLTTGTTELID